MFIMKYGAKLGLGINAQAGIFRLQPGNNEKPEASSLPPCLIPYLEDFAGKLPKDNAELGMALFLRDYLHANMRSQEIRGYISGNGTAKIRLNENGVRLLSKLLLRNENCGKSSAGNSGYGAVRDVKFSPDTAGITAEASGLRSLSDLKSAMAIPETAFDGSHKNAGQVRMTADAGTVTRPRQNAAGAAPTLTGPAGSTRLLKSQPPKPAETQSTRVRSRFTDVRRARQRWKERNIPVVSPTMDFFAGIVQFAQDDGDTIRYKGISSTEGRKAALDFSVNSFWLLMSVPSVSNAVTGVAANAASSILKGGSAVAGKYRFMARFHEIPGAAYSAAEPVWIGVEKLAGGSGAGKGIIHVGFAKFQAGAHLGLNFMGETHIYLSHVYIRSLNISIPNELIRELWKYYKFKNQIPAIKPLG